MVQTKRDSTVAVGAIEQAHDAFDAAMADGMICPVEVATIVLLLDRAVQTANLADTSTALSVCVARGGLDGDRFTELSSDYRRLRNAQVA